jgi:hypothetical protein
MTRQSTSRILQAFLILISTPVWSQATAPLTQVVQRISPVETLGANPSGVPRLPGSTVAFHATVSGVAVAAPTGTLHFVLADTKGAVVATGDSPIVAGVASWTATPCIGVYTVSAAYPGDLNYLPQSAALAPQNPAEDFAFTLPSVTIAQGQTWSGNLQVTSLNGFTGTINWTCVPTSGTVKCSMPQNTNTFTTANESTPQNVALTIPTSPGDFIPAAAVLLFSFGFGMRKRLKHLRLGAGVALSCFCLSGMIGCGSGGNAAWNLITPKASYPVTVTGTSGNITHTQTLTVVVQ